ncbi:hypothetical protein LCGC14_2289240, partial [marine sediment metagenome]
VYAGSLYVVSSGHTLARNTTSGGTFARPWATVNYAFQRSQVNTRNAGGPNDGDLIVCMPGHVEPTCITAGGYDWDSAGATVYCLGNGSDRATFRIGTTDTAGGTNSADMDIDAPNISCYNAIFEAGSPTNAIDINADYASFVNCETRDGVTKAGYVGGPPENWFVTASGVDYFTLENHSHFGTGTNEAAQDPSFGGADIMQVPRAFVELIGGTGHYLSFLNIDGNFNMPIFGFGTQNTDTAQFNIHDVYARNRNSNDEIGSTSTGSSGRWGPNVYIRLADNAANFTESLVLGGSHAFAPIGVVNANGEISGTDFESSAGGTSSSGQTISRDI